jgi:nucleoside-diphosphate-sugar epimerase
MLELAEAVIKVTGSRSKVIHMPLPKDDPKKRCPDITRARTQLGWEPKVALAEGLKSTMEWYKAKLEQSRAKS